MLVSLHNRDTAEIKNKGGQIQKRPVPENIVLREEKRVTYAKQKLAENGAKQKHDEKLNYKQLPPGNAALFM